jgi:hypothetical protein
MTSNSTIRLYLSPSQLCLIKRMSNFKVTYLNLVDSHSTFLRTIPDSPLEAASSWAACISLAGRRLPQSFLPVSLLSTAARSSGRLAAAHRSSRREDSGVCWPQTKDGREGAMSCAEHGQDDRRER